MNSPQYGHGNYKATAHARANDPRPGVACGGEGAASFSKVRPIIAAPADQPRIIDVLVEPGKKMGGVDRYRSDEWIKFNVVGTVENALSKDAAKRCGWTARLVDKNGMSTNIATGSGFGNWQDASLANIATGAYTLTFATTRADDGLAGWPCLGKVTRKVDVFAQPGWVTGLKLTSNGVEGVANQWGILFISPQISGPACMYSVPRVGGGKNFTTTHMHQPGGDFTNFGGQMTGEDYPNDQSVVEVSIQGFGASGLACDGVAKKTIRIFDQPGKAGVVV